MNEVSSDKTTFMFKIVGVSFVSFMLVFNLFSYIVMQEMENTYNLLHKNHSILAMEANRKSEDLKYIVEYDPNEDKFQFTNNADNTELAKEFKYDLINSFIYESFSKSKDTSIQELRQILPSLKIKDSEYISSYAGLINAHLDNIGNLIQTNQGLF